MVAIERRLERAFLELLCERPLRTITVRMITNRAGIARTSFYNYYEDIPSMLAEIESRTLIEMNEIFESWPYMNIERVDSSRAFPMFVRSFRYVDEHDLVFRALFGEHGSLDFVRRYQDMVYGRMYSKIIDDGAGGAKPALAISYTVGGLTKLVIDWLEDPSQATPEDIAAIATNMMLYPLYRQAQ